MSTSDEENAATPPAMVFQRIPNPLEELLERIRGDVAAGEVVSGDDLAELRARIIETYESARELSEDDVIPRDSDEEIARVLGYPGIVLTNGWHEAAFLEQAPSAPPLRPDVPPVPALGDDPVTLLAEYERSVEVVREQGDWIEALGDYRVADYIRRTGDAPHDPGSFTWEIDGRTMNLTIRSGRWDGPSDETHS